MCTCIYMAHVQDTMYNGVNEAVSSIPPSFHSCIVETVSMQDKTIDDALRQFQQLFRMPVSRTTNERVGI